MGEFSPKDRLIVYIDDTGNTLQEVLIESGTLLKINGVNVLSANSGNITFYTPISAEVFAPTTASSIATKQYVDDQILYNPSIYITQLDDFPIPSGNIINLLPNTTYELRDRVNLLSNRLQFNPGTCLLGLSPLKHGLIYTGSENMITAISSNCSLSSISLDTTNISSSIFSITGNINMTTISIDNLSIGTVSGCNNIGNIANVATCNFQNTKLNLTNSGIVFSGVKNLDCNNNYFTSTTSGCKYITIPSGNSNALGIMYNNFTMSNNQTALQIADQSPVIGGSIQCNFFTRVESLINSFPLSDNNLYRNSKWLIRNNIGLSDSSNNPESYSYAFFEFASNTTVTPISNTTNYYKLLGTNSNQHYLGNFSITNNRITNLSLYTKNFMLDITGSIYSSNNNQTLRLALFKNGNINLCETELRAITAKNSSPIGLTYNCTLNNGDYIEVFVRNITATNSVTAEFLQVRLH